MEFSKKRRFPTQRGEFKEGPSVAPFGGESWGEWIGNVDEGLLNRKEPEREPIVSALIVQAIGLGDRGAEEILIKRYGPGLDLFLSYRCEDLEIASDLYQDVFGIVIAALRDRRVKDPLHLSTFILGTARNLVRNYSKKEKHHGVELGGEVVNQILDDSQDAFRECERWEKAAHVNDAMMLLCSRDQTVIQRYYFLGQSRSEICRDLDMKPEHFNRVIYRARQRLRAQLIKLGFE